MAACRTRRTGVRSIGASAAMSGGTSGANGPAGTSPDTAIRARSVRTRV
jgi:hypothetical protein